MSQLAHDDRHGDQVDHVGRHVDRHVGHVTVLDRLAGRVDLMYVHVVDYDHDHGHDQEASRVVGEE